MRGLGAPPVTVCHVTTVHPALDVRIARKELASLARAGFDCVLIAHGEPGSRDEALALGVDLVDLGPRRPARRLSRMVGSSARALVRALAAKASVYHVHDPELVPVGLVLKALGRRVILDVHEDLKAQIEVKHWIPPRARAPIGALARWLERVAARRFDAVVAATPFIGQLFEPYARRVAVVNNYPWTDELHDAGEPGGADWSARDRVLYVGGISELRGVRELVEAAGRARTRVLLAGSWFTAAERDRARALPGYAYVDELGQVGRAALRPLFGRSFAGICALHATPNHVNAQPIKLFEYMAAGLPVIASDFPLWRSIVEGAGCGVLVDPTRPERIADAIRHLREHPAQAREMGRRGREAVLGRFNWEREGEALVALYDELGVRRPAGRADPAVHA